MKISNISNVNTNFTDFENYFNVIDDKLYKFNLNETMYLDIDDNVLNDYVLKTDAFWPLISYKIYNTERLWWLLMKINKVSPNEIFNKKHAGDVIKYVDSSIASSIIEQL